LRQVAKRIDENAHRAERQDACGAGVQSFVLDWMAPYLHHHPS